MIARFGVEFGLVGSFLRSGGGPRAALLAMCTALVSGLMLVALTAVLFTETSPGARQQVSGLIADGGVRGGYVFALLLICLAPLTLLRQVVRLGTATREQRLAALRLAGATPAEVRRLGALEVGLPALAGGFLGYVVFVVLRMIFGDGADGLGVGGPETEVARQLRLVPTGVHLAWWHVLAVALAVGLIGALAGASTSRLMRVTPLGVSHRSPRSAPRPWAALALLGTPFFLLSSETGFEQTDLVTFAFVLSVVLGMLLLAPFVAYWIGRGVSARASRLPLLMAGRRLKADARPAGRAAAAVGAIALVTGVGSGLLATLPDTNLGGDFGDVDPFYTVPMALAGLVLLVALLLVVFSMAVHEVESLIDRKRSIASLAALGVSVDELEQVQRWEIGLVALPMAVIGVCFGSGPWVLFLVGTSRYAWIPLVADGVTIALVWLAVRAATRITRPWLVRASAPANLRTA